MTLRTFSFGGGVQSTAALVLAAQGKIDFPTFLFANVGDDSEHPDTLRYVRDVAMPYAAASGIELVELNARRNGKDITLYQEILSEEWRGIPIPVRGISGAPGKRSCTKNYKAVPISQETRRRGATKKTPAIVGLGISLDEYHRMNTSWIAWQVFEYPLIDLRLTRDSCEEIIRTAGLDVPPKSACWFCPFLRQSRWREMKERQPNIFMNAVILEYDINVKQNRNGRPPVYLTRFAKPLDRAFEGDQAMMDFDDTCESGFCMT